MQRGLQPQGQRCTKGSTDTTQWLQHQQRWRRCRSWRVAAAPAFTTEWPALGCTTDFQD